MKKRILGILLALCMVLSIMPTAMMSADGEIVAIATSSTGERLRDFKALSSSAFGTAYGGSLILLQDVSYSGWISGTFKFVGGEHRLTGSCQLERAVQIVSGSFEDITIRSSSTRLSGGKFDSLKRSTQNFTWKSYLLDSSAYDYYDMTTGERLAEADIADLLELTGVEVRRIEGDCTHANMDSTGYCPDCKKTFVATTTQNGKTYFHETIQYAVTYFSLGTAESPVTLKLLCDLTTNTYLVFSLGTGTFDLNGKIVAGTVSVQNQGLGDAPDVTLAGGGQITGQLDMNTSTVRIESGTFANVYITNGSTVILSGGTYSCIEYWDSNKVMTDFLANDAENDVWYEYNDLSGKFVDGSRKTRLENVKVVPHTEHHFGSNKKCSVCGADDSTPVDNEPPVATFDETEILGRGVDGKGRNYVEIKGDTLHFTLSDASGIRSVTENYRTLTPDENGLYSIAITDTVGYRQVRLEVYDKVGNRLYLDFMVYPMVETSITSVADGMTVLEICGDPVTEEKPANAIRWRRICESYSLKVKVPAGFNASWYLRANLSDQFQLAFGKPDENNITSAGSGVSLISASKTEGTPFPLSSLKNIIVRRVADTKAPNATVSFKGNEYSGFTKIFTSVGYGLFYKDGITVNVAADDDNSGVGKAEYLFTEKQYYYEPNLKNLADGWREIELDSNGKGSFAFTSEAKGFLYVRFTDRDGNIKIVNAPTGLVIYNDAKIKDGESDTISKTHKELVANGLTLPIDLLSSDVDSIVCTKSDGNNIPMTRNQQYRVSTNASTGEKAITLDIDNFLKTIVPGTYTLNVAFKPMGVDYVEANGNEAPNTFTITLIVKTDFRTVYITNLLTKYYDSEPVSPEYTVSEGGGQVKFEYKARLAPDSTYSTEVPEKVGEYTVRVSVTGDEFYMDAYDTQDFKIRRREVTVENVKIKDKFYDGTNVAQFDGTPTANGLIAGDDVKLIIGEPSFADKNVGEGISINITDFKLSGADADNYTIVQPSGITASIKVYVADKSEYTVNSNDWINEDFVVKSKEGWLLSLANSPDGEWVDTLTVSQENNDGTLTFYVKRISDGAISEAVSEGYKIDKTAPTGKISINELNFWQSFIKTITFGLFFKDDQTVTIEAFDNSEDDIIIEYLLSDEIFTKEQLDGKEFTAYEGSFGIAPDKKVIVYARLTDKAGNVYYLCSEGIVLDSTAPVITGADNDRTYCGAVTLTISDDYLADVKLNGVPVELTDGKLVVSPAEGEQTIEAIDEAGNSVSITITVNDGHTFGDWQSNGDGTHTRNCTINGCTTGVETEDCTDDNKDHKCDYCGATLSECADDDKDHNCDYCGKKLTDHTGGEATCCEKAVCDICSKPYGETDESNHSDLKHFPEKAATKDAEGNIEYWHCDGCGKYFADQAASKEITEADTVIAKLPADRNVPKTGDDFGIIARLAVLLLSGGVFAGIVFFGKRKKYFAE